MFLKSRRLFLQSGFLSSAVFVMSGCELFGVTTPLQTIALVQDDIFPQAKRLGIKVHPYMSIVLNHSRISEDDKEYIRDGVKWLNEVSVAKYKKMYMNLSSKSRQEILKTISKEEWGDSWLYNIMSYTFEAMLGDPIYGGNNYEAGWKWLNFSGGLPRPKEALL